MNPIKLLPLALLPLTGFLGACQTIDEVPNERLAYAELRKADGSAAGFARLLSNGGDIDIAVALTDMPPGLHGVHLHAAGSCDPPDFASSGGHLNPSGNEHGMENPQGPHLGDLPNAPVGATGAGNMSATLRGAAGDLLPILFDADGTALIVHAGPDDYRSDPAGNAGSRIACGVFTRN